MVSGKNPKTLHIEDISHALVMLICPKCNKSLTFTIDNMDPRTCRCWCCDYRFVPKIVSVEISYREVVSVDEICSIDK